MSVHLPSLRRLSPLFTVAVFGFALYAIHLEIRQVRTHSREGILDALGSIDPARLAIAAALVIPGLLALACYDLVAARFLRLGIGWWRPLMIGVLGYSITNTTGHGVLVGGLLRLRIYPRLGVTGPQIGALVGFGVLTYYLGLSVVSATALILEGSELRNLLSGLPRIGTWFEGNWFRYAAPAVLLTGVLLWFVLITVRRRPLVIRGHEVRLPTPGIGLVQLAVSVADLVIASTVLFVLLPDHHDLGWLEFMGIFSVVQFASLMSGVPGGIGVFSAIMIGVIGPRFPGDAETDLLASLIAFRILYYLIPFAIGGTTFLGLVGMQNLKRGRSESATT